jgi:hypothetical protein
MTSEKDGADDEAFWRQMERMPDLQALVERIGRRHAASIGEEYIEDPFRRMREAPHQGGYSHITPEDWARWDRANEVYQVRRREGNGDDTEHQTGPHAGPHTGPHVDRMNRMGCTACPLIPPPCGTPHCACGAQAVHRVSWRAFI